VWELIYAVVAIRRRNPHFGCCKIAEQPIASAFGINLSRYRPPESPGTFRTG